MHCCELEASRKKVNARTMQRCTENCLDKWLLAIGLLRHQETGTEMLRDTA